MSRIPYFGVSSGVGEARGAPKKYNVTQDMIDDIVDKWNMGISAKNIHNLYYKDKMPYVYLARIIQQYKADIQYNRNANDNLVANTQAEIDT